MDNIVNFQTWLANQTTEVCILCPDKTQLGLLMETAAKIGFNWTDRNANYYWDEYEEDTCYFFNPQTKGIEYCDARYAHKHGHMIYTMDGFNAFNQCSPRNKYKLYHTDIKKYIGIAGGKMVFTNATINGLNRQVEFTEKEIQNNSLIQTFLTITEPHKLVRQRC